MLRNESDLRVFTRATNANPHSLDCSIRHIDPPAKYHGLPRRFFDSNFFGFLFFSVLVFVLHLLVYNVFPDRRETSSAWCRTYSRSNSCPLMVHNANAPQRDRAAFVTVLFEAKGPPSSKRHCGRLFLFCISLLSKRVN